MTSLDNSYTLLSNLRTISFDDVIIYENIWLGNICNLVGGRYLYTFNNTDTNTPNNNVNLLITAIRYKMATFIYKSGLLLRGENIKYSTGSAWFGEGTFNNAGFGIDSKIDIQTMIRSICRQEIEYSLWNFILKLKENNVFDGNPSDLRLKWFHNIEYPSNNITINGFPIGTDNTEFSDIDLNIYNVNSNNIGTGTGNTLGGRGGGSGGVSRSSINGSTNIDNSEILINNQN